MFDLLVHAVVSVFNYLWGILPDLTNLLSTMFFVALVSSVKRSGKGDRFIRDRPENTPMGQAVSPNESLSQSMDQSEYFAEIEHAYEGLVEPALAVKSYHIQIQEDFGPLTRAVAWLGIGPDPVAAAKKFPDFQQELLARYPEAANYNEALWIREREQLEQPDLDWFERLLIWLDLLPRRQR